LVKKRWTLFNLSFGKALLAKGEEITKWWEDDYKSTSSTASGTPSPQRGNLNKPPCFVRGVIE